MTIRITGMNSGLDTETIINELASARSMKVTSLQKAQTKLSWKIDAWQTLNTKIYGFYTNTLSDLRFQGTYAKKTTRVSNSNAVSVITGGNAMNGTQKLNINQLAQTGYLTGAKLKKAGQFSGDVTADTTLRALGYDEDAKIKVKVGGEEKEIELKGDSKMSDVATALRNAGLNANFDEATGRFFVSAAKSGEAADFEIVGADTKSNFALAALGLNTEALEAPDLDAMKSSAVADYEKQIKDLTDQLGNATLTDADKQSIRDKIDETRALLTYDGSGKATGLSEAGERAVERRYDQEVDDYNRLRDSMGDVDAVKASKIKGQDAMVWLNGVQFTFDSNTFEVNGLTYTINQVTDPDPTGMAHDENNAVTVTTEMDTSGIYDMIKDFLKQYNDLIKEMDTLYNADSAKKYEPLTSEEKDALSDKEVEEWEKKIKDSLLRRDGTLNTVILSMKEIMLGGYSVTDKNGSTKTMYLGNLGISTLSYFASGDNEKGVFHIDGDSDDSNTKANEDKLRKAIADDPDMVMGFFTQLSTTLYNKLTDLMGRTDYSSAYKIYNDKQMDIELKSYDSKIKSAESKLNDYMDKWYSKFSDMEVALSKLDSKTNAIMNMFG